MKYLLILSLFFISCGSKGRWTKEQKVDTLFQHWLESDSLYMACNNYTGLYTILYANTFDKEQYKVTLIKLGDTCVSYWIAHKWEPEVTFKTRNQAEYILNSWRLSIKQYNYNDSVERVSHIYKKCDN